MTDDQAKPAEPFREIMVAFETTCLEVSVTVRGSIPASDLLARAHKAMQSALD